MCTEIQPLSVAVKRLLCHSMLCPSLKPDREVFRMPEMAGAWLSLCCLCVYAFCVCVNISALLFSHTPFWALCFAQSSLLNAPFEIFSHARLHSVNPFLAQSPSVHAPNTLPSNYVSNPLLYLAAITQQLKLYQFSNKYSALCFYFIHPV